MKVIKGSIVCSHSKGYFLQINDKIYSIDGVGENKEFLCKLDRKGIKKFLSKFGRLGQRLVRSDIRAAAIFDDKLYFSDFGICYSYDIKRRELIAQHMYRPSMHAPLAFCVIENIAGFDDQICYGEYFSNENRETVNIWHKKKNSARWEVAASFQAGIIRHIHGMFSDKYRNCVYILTGDKNEESNIWVATDNFRSIKKMFASDQKARCCQLIVNQSGFLYCTDSEYEENALYDVVIDKTDRLKYIRNTIGSFDGSIIYGCASGDEFYFSTTVEPNKGGIKSNDVKVYHINVRDQVVYDIFSAKKDIFPMKLFQYGFARISVASESIAMSFNGVKRYDGQTVIMDY